MADNRKETEKSLTGIGASASATASTAAGQMRDAAEVGREKMRETWEDASDLASEYSDDMQRYASRQMQTMRNYFSDNPLMLGVVGLGVGLLAGALIPVTRAERRYLRPLGRELRQNAGDTLRQVRRKVDEMAADAETEIEPQTGARTQAGTQRHQPSRSRH